MESIIKTWIGLYPRRDYSFNPGHVDSAEEFNMINRVIRRKMFVTPLTMILGYIFDKLYIMKLNDLK